MLLHHYYNIHVNDDRLPMPHFHTICLHY